MRRMRVFFFYMIVVFMSMSSFAAKIQTRLDRNPVALGESFQLIFSTQQTPENDPDFSPLNENFTVLGQSSNSKISMINGVSNKTLSWTVAVMAKKAGIQLIPSISFGNDHSQPVKIEVKDEPVTASGSSANQTIFMQVTVEPKNPYVQAQAIYTMKLYHQIDIAQARLDEPSLEDAIIEKLGEDATYRTTLGGKTYRVVERKYAVFPQKSGQLKFPPLTLQAQVVTGRRSGLGGFFGHQNTTMKRLRSNSVTLDVQPIPEAFTGQHWLPAEDLQLTEDWSINPSELTTGEAVTRTIALLAQGITAGQLPELGLLQAVQPAAHYDTLKQYPDQPILHEEKEPNGIASFREEKTAMIPSQSGNYTLGAIDIPWWNTKTNKMEVARLPERTLSVAAGSRANSVSAVVNTDRASPANQAGVHPLSVSQPLTQQQIYWKWLALALTVGWLITCLLWWYSRQKMNKPVTKSQPESIVINAQVAIKNLKKACANDVPQQAKEALLLWAKSRWPKSPPASLGAIQPHCEGALQLELARLNQVLYQSHTESWSGTALWQAFKSQQKNTGANKQRAGSDAMVLQPLYKTV